MHYILCNLESKSTETRLCQSDIYPAARAMKLVIGVHPCRRILVCTQTVSECFKRDGQWELQVILFPCALRVVPDGYTCLPSFVGCFACKGHDQRSIYIHKSGILNPWLSDFIFSFADHMKAINHTLPGRLFSLTVVASPTVCEF